MLPLTIHEPLSPPLFSMDLTPPLSAPKLFDLSGKNALVTGGTRGNLDATLIKHYHIVADPCESHPYGPGIGAACAIALAEAGANICLVQRVPTDGAPPSLETYNTILALGVQVKIVHCDLSDIPAVRSIFQSALEAMGGRIHILVNCAGIQRRSPCVDFSERDWDDVRLSYLLPVPGFTMSRGTHQPRPSPCSAFLAGHRRQPQVCLAAVPGCWQAYDTSPRREDHQLLFPDVISGRAHHSGLHCREGCSSSAHQVAQQRMEPTQCPGQWHRSWIYRHGHVSTISSTARVSGHLGFQNCLLLVAEGYAKTSYNLSLCTRNEKLLNDPMRLQQISERIPAGRWGQPKDFAGPTVFLASNASQYVCGELLVVDGVSVSYLFSHSYPYLTRLKGWLGR